MQKGLAIVAVFLSTVLVFLYTNCGSLLEINQQVAEQTLFGLDVSGELDVPDINLGGIGAGEIPSIKPEEFTSLSISCVTLAEVPAVGTGDLDASGGFTLTIESNDQTPFGCFVFNKLTKDIKLTLVFEGNQLNDKNKGAMYVPSLGTNAVNLGSIKVQDGIAVVKYAQIKESTNHSISQASRIDLSGIWQSKSVACTGDTAACEEYIGNNKEPNSVIIEQIGLQKGAEKRNHFVSWYNEDVYDVVEMKFVPGRPVDEAYAQCSTDDNLKTHMNLPGDVILTRGFSDKLPILSPAADSAALPDFAGAGLELTNIFEADGLIHKINAPGYGIPLCRYKYLSGTPPKCSDVTAGANLNDPVTGNALTDKDCQMLCVLEDSYDSKYDSVSPAIEKTTCFDSDRRRYASEKVYAKNRTTALADICNNTNGSSCGNQWDGQFIGTRLLQANVDDFAFSDAEADRGILSFQNSSRNNYQVCDSMTGDFCDANSTAYYCEVVVNYDYTVKKVSEDKYLVSSKKQTILGVNSENPELCRSKAPSFYAKEIDTIIYPVSVLERVKK